MKNPNAKNRTSVEKMRHTIASAILTLLVVILPAGLLAAPTIVAVNDVPNGRPVIQVIGAPNGYDIYTGDCVATAGVEDGALITLFGVDTSGSIPDWGGRFVVSNSPEPNRAAVDIVWVQHDTVDACDLFGHNDLQIGFNSANPGVYYGTPGLVSSDDNLGTVTDKWVQVYASETVIILVDSHTYRLRK